MLKEMTGAALLLVEHEIAASMKARHMYGSDMSVGSGLLQLDPAHLPFSHHGVQGDRDAPNIASMHISHHLTLQQVCCTALLPHPQMHNPSLPNALQLIWASGEDGCS